MTLYKLPRRYNPSQLAKQQGVVAIEMALIIAISVMIFSFSYQLGRQLYWQQHFNYASDRLAKLLVLDISQTRTLNISSFDDALSLLEHKDFATGLRINILSDIKSDEQSFNIGSGCNAALVYPDKMEKISEVITAAQLNSIPPRYMLGISVCAQPKNWQNLTPLIDSEFFSLPLHSHSYYPINHLVFNE